MVFIMVIVSVIINRLTKVTFLHHVFKLRLTYIVGIVKSNVFPQKTLSPQEP